MVARESWYEIHTQLQFQSEFLPFRSGAFHTGVKALAIKQNNHLPQLAAHYFSSDSDLLYVCVHNPMTELHIIEMKELIVKAKRDILLLIILPVCEPFSAQLDNFPPAGLHAHKDARTLCDVPCRYGFVANAVELTSIFQIGTGVAVS